MEAMLQQGRKTFFAEPIPEKNEDLEQNDEVD
jgi:hypothetical protein